MLIFNFPIIYMQGMNFGIFSFTPKKYHRDIIIYHGEERFPVKLKSQSCTLDHLERKKARSTSERLTRTKVLLSVLTYHMKNQERPTARNKNNQSSNTTKNLPVLERRIKNRMVEN